MTERLVSPDRENALVSLLDDPSPTVQKAVMEEFKRLEGEGLSILRRAVRESSGQGKEQATRLLELLSGPDPARQLEDFIRSLRYDLETGLYLINRVIDPDLELDSVREAIDGLARRCRELRVLPMKPVEQAKVINRVLFHEAGFRGNFEDFDDPLNSCIDAVLRRRKGLPITLSCLYILVAQRLGLDLEPVALPGYFVVGCFQDQKPFYIDPFERGRFRSVEEMRDMLVGFRIPPELHHMAPSPLGDVLCRVCRNLVAHFDTRQETGQAAQFRRFIRVFEETYRRRSET